MRAARLAAFAACALALWPATAADARTVRGTNHADVLRGTQRADVLLGRGGNDRLFGRGGNDRLIGGPGRDRLLCGRGRDVAIAGARDRVQGCEVVKDSAGRVVPVGQQDAGGGGGPAPAGCRYRTKPVLVLQLNGLYLLENRVVLECDTPPAGGGGGTPAPAPDSPWVGTLLQRNGFWFQYAPPLDTLYRFTNDGAAGVRRGIRTTYPTGNASFGQSFPFTWVVQGDTATLRFVSGYTETVQLLGYGAAADTIAITSGGAGQNAWYGCGAAEFPAVFRIPQVCP